MATKTLPTTTTLLAAVAALSVTLTGAACSGDAGGSGASTDARAARTRTTTRTERTGAADSASARLATAKFDVDGMTCGGCALATEMSVRKLEGVKSVDASYDEAADEGRCTVKYDPTTVGTEQIAAAIEKAGFTPTLKGTGGSG